ncbi:hypothetical protein HPB52_013627 [Rhipicephalus sanguineus]|uniref:Sulfotransferase domain-containing protein n=1 Tax=Rhipicephalus sanguineus TaxID=34632 RepID=A0A9D4QB14_RHISA|nr:hypothetical protein HPB52_013627 [Rhipicephalus sanguineus]
MSFRFQPYSKDAKYIYVARNPYDCCVSYFYHTRDMPEYNFQDGTFDKFFEMFLRARSTSQLKKDVRAWVFKIADFIGDEYGQKLRMTTAAIGRNVPKWIALLKEAVGAEACEKPMSGDFVRKGVVGDWRNHFSEDQVKRLQNRLRKRREDLIDQLLSWIEMPFLEGQGAESIDEMKKPRPIESHLPFRLETFSKEAKYMYMARNPYNCCVFFFYHNRGMPEYKF